MSQRTRTGDVPLWPSPVPQVPDAGVRPVRVGWRGTALRRDCGTCDVERDSAVRRGELPQMRQRARQTYTFPTGEVRYYCTRHALDAGWTGRA